jgi:hypothetical protein
VLTASAPSDLIDKESCTLFAKCSSLTRLRSSPLKGCDDRSLARNEHENNHQNVGPRRQIFDIEPKTETRITSIYHLMHIIVPIMEPNMLENLR